MQVDGGSAQKEIKSLEERWRMDGANHIKH